MVVLIVEDDEGLGELIKRIVEKCGFKAVNVYTAKDALQWLGSSTPHIMLLDYGLPDLNAQEFITELRNQGKQLPPTIISTGQGDERLIEEILTLGVSDYIQKDARFLEMLPLVIQRVSEQIQKMP